MVASRSTSRIFIFYMHKAQESSWFFFLLSPSACGNFPSEIQEDGSLAANHPSFNIVKHLNNLLCSGSCSSPATLRRNRLLAVECGWKVQRQRSDFILHNLFSEIIYSQKITPHPPTPTPHTSKVGNYHFWRILWGSSAQGPAAPPLDLSVPT